MSEKENFWKSLGWPEWVAMGLVFAVIVMVTAISSSGFRDVIASGATAAWVQALGSIIALFVAVYLAATERHQRRIEREMDKWLRDRDCADDVAGVTLELHKRVVQLKVAAAAELEKSVYISEILFFKDLLARLKESTVGAAPMAQKNQSFEIRMLIDEVLRYVIAQAQSDSATPQPNWASWIERADSLFKQANMPDREMPV